MKRERRRLEELAADGRSVISGPFGSDIGSRFFQESGVPVIRGNNLTTDHRKFVDQGFAFLSEEKADDLNAYAVCDDIIFTAAGTIGQVGIIPKNSRYQKYIISNKQLRIRIDPEKADPTFVYYWLASPWIFRAIQNRNTGSTVPLINLGTIRSLPILLPECLEDQRRVAGILGAIDEKIEVNNQINDELEGMARLLYDYWFVQFDFPITTAQAAAMGNPKLKGKPYRTSGGKMVSATTLQREIPLNWKPGNLADTCHLNACSWRESDFPDEILYIDLSNAKHGRILEPQRISRENAPSRAQRILRQGDTIIGTVRPANRSFAWVPDSSETLTGSTGFAVLTANSPIFTEFNYFASTSEHNMQRLETVASGAAYPAVNPEVVTEYPIAIPEESVMKMFHDTVSPLMELFASNETQNRELAQLRDWLLPMLMNGQVTISESAADE